MIKFFSLKQQQQQQQQSGGGDAAANPASTTATAAGGGTAAGTAAAATTTSGSASPAAAAVATAATAAAGAEVTTKKKPKAAHLRVQKDLGELSLPKNVKIDFPNADDLLSFKLTIQPDEGIYKGGSFDFTFKIKDNYPHEPPKVRCLNKIYHPNIDLDGGVCLNILRDDWMPVLSIQSVVYGLQFLFLVRLLWLYFFYYFFFLGAKPRRPTQQGRRRGLPLQP